MTEVDTMAIRQAAIRQRIAQACERAGRAPDSVTLLPVSKTFEVDAIREAMALGLARFGENKTQELRQKAAALAGQGLQWVLIGHLQTNKAKDAARDATELQSLDRIDLAEALHRRLVLEGRTLDVLVQVKTSSEPSKYGMAPSDVSAFLRRIVAEAVAEQVAPLRHSLAAMQSGGPRMSEVAGGIGYIVGLAGIALWARSRRR